ncbi:MAG TPA: hypothetical protein VLM91_16750 [Candidatus Methylomirabilis sp.]|nr:hypothetical protein [Candidatus Methylomirabilis sp.]
MAMYQADLERKLVDAGVTLSRSVFRGRSIVKALGASVDGIARRG